jgi:hypothetical protein
MYTHNDHDDQSIETNKADETSSAIGKHDDNNSVNNSDICKKELEIDNMEYIK